MKWRPVIDPYGRGYVTGLDPNRVYEFGRDEWDETKFFRLSEASPYMNAAGLYFREAATSK